VFSLGDKDYEMDHGKQKKNLTGEKMKRPPKGAKRHDRVKTIG
jgi:hypothetical protein